MVVDQVSDVVVLGQAEVYAQIGTFAERLDATERCGGGY